ncbi:hypothetical protein QYE76_029748 [Lolium multiflorum]|uniref:RNase H type-1 domain-containing protein n=1 Tax=Lolium multiflorum TaxID=4521 RepID=A0AAD8QND6_LOLMU|nr:hypothetical protein QYE76_029748 [Lolium multiflorum]
MPPKISRARHRCSLTQLPPRSWVKLNTDASFIGLGKPSAAGAIARDHSGKVLMAACSPLPNCEDAEEAEIEAALMGIKMLAGQGHQHVTIELDCAAVAKALQSPVNRSKQWALYDEAKTLLMMFEDHKVVHVNRESNMVADALAKIGRSAAKLETAGGHGSVATDNARLGAAPPATPEGATAKADTSELHHHQVGSRTFGPSRRAGRGNPPPQAPCRLCPVTPDSGGSLGRGSDARVAMGGDGSKRRTTLLANLRSTQAT